jgi:hypothetical protein
VIDGTHIEMPMRRWRACVRACAFLGTGLCVVGADAGAEQLTVERQRPVRRRQQQINPYASKITSNVIQDLQLTVALIQRDSAACTESPHTACTNMHSALKPLTFRVLDTPRDGCSALRPLITLPYST